MTAVPPLLWPPESVPGAVRAQVDRGSERIPHPEPTPDALRAALAVIAPDRLDEMRVSKDETFAEAVRWGLLSPLQGWVLAWARDIEIARRPDLSARYAWAQRSLEHADPVIAREALRELSAVLEEATQEAMREAATGVKAVRVGPGSGS